MSLLSVRHIISGYGKKQVLFDVSFDIEQGETVLLVGSNGSGKSTLFKNIYQTLPLWENEDGSKGQILYNGKDITMTPTHELIKQGIMYIPQKNELFEDMTVEENLKMSTLFLGSKRETRVWLNEVFDKMDDLSQRAKQPVNELSGGERKMLSLGMVSMSKPSLLLYDEPLAGLAGPNVLFVISWLQSIARSGTTVLIIEHRIKELVGLTDKVIGLKLGRMNAESLKNIENIKSFMV